MIIKDEILSFISAEPHFTAEKLGLKNNTIREVDLTDERFRKLVIMYEMGEYGKITIHDGGFIDAKWFTRQIQHISFWKNLVIITWEHDKE